eukprot:380637-Pyramimonas_sp.AAC.1
MWVPGNVSSEMRQGPCGRFEPLGKGTRRLNLCIVWVWFWRCVDVDQVDAASVSNFPPLGPGGRVARIGSQPSTHVIGE